MSFNLPTDLEHRPVAVIGAGTLGRRIALMFAAHGAEVKISAMRRPRVPAPITATGRFSKSVGRLKLISLS